MDENKLSLRRYAMYFGTCMGIYWIIKFIIFLLGLSSPFLSLLFTVLTIAVPFIGVYYTRSFRNRICGGSITFMQSWAFMVFMYISASLLVAVAHYIYFRFMDNGHVMDVYARFAGAMEQEEALAMIRSMSAIEITMLLFLQNILYCSILTLITAPFAVKRKQVVP
jgi:hypothetical protein